MWQTTYAYAVRARLLSKIVALYVVFNFTRNVHQVMYTKKTVFTLEWHAFDSQNVSASESEKEKPAVVNW